MVETTRKVRKRCPGVPRGKAGRITLGSLAAFLAIGVALWMGCAEEPVSPSAPPFEPDYFIETVAASPGQVGVGGYTSTISAAVVDRGEDPANGVMVSFDAENWGTISAKAVTDSLGVARAVFTSGTKEGLARITARVGAFSKSTVVLIGEGSLEANPPALLANGVEVSVITAQVMTANGRADSGSVVAFQTSAGSITPRARADAAGVATAMLTSAASREDVSAVVTARLDSGTGESEPFGITLVEFTGVTLDLESSHLAIPADGSSEAVLTASLRETESLVPIPHEFVQFASDKGVAVGESQTDERGHAASTLTSSLEPGTARVIANYGKTISDTIEVVFSSLDLSLTASPATVRGDGVSRSEVIAVLKDLRGEALVQRIVGFEADQGSVTPADTTNSSGVALASFTAPVAERDTTVVVRASGLGVTQTLAIPIRGLTLSVASDPAVLVADASSQSEITVTLVETTSGEPLASEEVRLRTNLGSIDTVAVTNSDGVAVASFDGGAKTGTATIRVEFGDGLISTTRVEVVSAEVASVNLSCLPGAIIADGFNTAQVRAVVKDSGNRSIPDGMIVKFYTSAGLITAQSETEEGVAQATLTSGTVVRSNVEVVAECSGVRDTTHVDFIPGVPATIELAVLPDSIPADGTTTASLVATVQDSIGHPVRDGTLVLFNIIVGLADTTASDTVEVRSTTDGGVAATYYTAATRAGLAVITAVAGEVSDQATLVLTASGVASIILKTNRHSITVRGVGGVETATVTAEVRDKNGNPVAEGTEVEFSVITGPGGPTEENLNNSGWGPVLIPTANGSASATLSAGRKSGVVGLAAACQGIVAQDAEITIDSGPPDTVTTSIDWREVVYGGDGTYTAIISALVRDEYNNPVENGTAVYFTLDPEPPGTFIEGSAVTGNEAACGQTWEVIPLKGLAHTCLTYPSEDIFEGVGIHATVLDGSHVVSDSLYDVLRIIEGVLSAWASPTYIFFAGCDSVGCDSLSTTISALLLDKYQRPVDGGVIDIVSDSYRAIPVWPTIVTDQNGWAGTEVVFVPGPSMIVNLTAILRGTSITSTVEIKIEGAIGEKSGIVGEPRSHGHKE